MVMSYIKGWTYSLAMIHFQAPSHWRCFVGTRTVNDFASAVCSLEVKDKRRPHMQIYPYVIQELRSTLNELGSSR